MATPNGRGGWDLTDADVAEVMSASFGQQDTPEYPRREYEECSNSDCDTLTLDRFCETCRDAYWIGQDEERGRVRSVIADHYRVAPKAAEPLLRALGYAP